MEHMDFIQNIERWWNERENILFDTYFIIPIPNTYLIRPIIRVLRIIDFDPQNCG